MTTNQIRQRLEMILDFMQPHWEFVNCHMVNYLTDQHWERLISTNVRNEVNNIEKVQACIEREFWQQPTTKEINNLFPSVNNFLSLSKKHCLESFTEVLRTAKDLKREIGLVEIEEKNSVSIKEFLTQKKRHEVEIMAELVNDLISFQFDEDAIKENVFIVDAGDGKGYLSSRLCLEYGYKVLGIDANETNTANALERNRKLQRAWNGLVERADLIQSGVTPPRRGKKTQNPSTQVAPMKKNSNYRTAAKFIDANVCFSQLLREHFVLDNNIPTPQICLTGLHTCGNLAPTCLRVFVAQPNCRILCNIGCCYHFLKEAHTTSKWEHSTPFTNHAIAVGFPMSNFLSERKIKLGRNARMLAAQCVERTLSQRELPNISLFYRALLEVIIFRQNPELYNKYETIQVGRLRKFKDFKDYLAQCAKKTNLSKLVELDEKFIEAIEMEFSDHRHFLEIFYLIRMHFAPILESLILLDRLLYLRESGFERSYLVSAFDAVISPRHHAIIAFRN